MSTGEHGDVTVVVMPRVGRRKVADALLVLCARGAALCVLLMLAVLVVVLARAAVPAFQRFGPGFVTSTEWRANDVERPKKDAAGHVMIEDGEVVMETLPASFGALPALVGTAASSFLALALALPVGILTAVLLVRVGPRRRSVRVVGSLVEFLAAVPSIAFGMWGLVALAPILGRNLLAGSVVLAVMVAPIVVAVSRDVLRAVPVPIVEGAIALGATWWQTSWTMIRESRSGLFGAAVLAFARAAGETMAVTMVIGNANRIPTSLTDPAQTMASLLANEFAEASGELHRAALLEVALLLLASSLLLNVVARTLIVRRRR